MSADIGAAEVVGKTVIKEAAIPANNQSQEDIAALELRKIVAEKGVDTGLRSAAERTIDQGIFDRAIDESIGSERDEEGKMVRKDGTPEKDKHDKIKITEATVLKYLNEGYDSLTNPQKIEVCKGVRNMVLTYPALRKVYDGLDINGKQALLERVARDPNYSKFVAEWMNGVIDPSKIQPETVSALQLEITNLDKRIEEINKRLNTDSDNLEKRIKQLQEDLEDYKGSGSSKKEVKIRKIDRMRAESVEIEEKLEPLQEQRNNLEERLKNLKRNKATALQEGKDTIKIKIGEGLESISLDELSKRITNIEKSLSDGSKEYRDLLAKKQALTSQITRYDEGDFEGSLKKELDEALKEKKDLEKEKTDLNEKLTKKKRDLGVAKTQRTFEEEQFVKNLESVFSEAASKYFEAEVSKAETERKLLFEKMATEAKTKLDEDIMLGLRDRYFPTDKEKKRIKAQQSRDDYKEIVANGPDKIITEILKAKGYDDAKITEIKKDTAKWNELKEKVSVECIAFYMLRGGWFNRGGKTHPDEITKLGMTPHLQEVMTKAITRSDAIQAQIKENFGRLPEHAKLGEWIRGLDFKKLLILLAIIAGLAGIGIFAAGRLGG